MGLGPLPLYAACIRYGYLWHCRGKAGSGPASPGPMRDALLGRSLIARTVSGSPGWVTSPQLYFRVDVDDDDDDVDVTFNAQVA